MSIAGRGTLAGKLLALDVDGTLLRSDGSVSARTVEALEAARDAGAVISLATGRDWTGVVGLLAEVGGSVEYSLCINGVEVFHADGRALFANELDVTVARRAIETLRRELPGIGVGAGLGGDLVGEALIEAAMPTGVADVVVVDDILDAIGPGLRDLVLVHPDHGDLHAFHARCRELLPFEGLDVAFTGLPMIELVPPGSGKHTGLAWLAHHLGIDRGDVVAFGDGLNDLAMLRWAGLGVAMGQATPVVRGAADVATRSNADDGIAHWIDLTLGDR